MTFSLPSTSCLLKLPIENETAANEEESEGGRVTKIWGGGADKNGMSNFIFSTPTFYFAPPPLQLVTNHQCFKAA